MVRSILSILFFAVLGALFVGCFTAPPSPYASVRNWVIRGNAVPSYFAEYDLIFIYPRISRSADRLPDLPQNRVTLSYVHDYAAFVTEEAFGKKVRVFAPVIHRTEDSEFAKLLASGIDDWRDTEAEPSIAETVEAIRFYLKKYHTAKRPYILLGHDQGSILVYEALKELRGEVRPNDGCVAVYLPELPQSLMARIGEDFDPKSDWLWYRWKKGRLLSPVMGRYDTGVIAAWRTEVATPENAVTNRVIAPGLVNPLNWSVIRPADETFCHNACYYDIDQTNVLFRKIQSAGFCRAEPDGSNLCLRVERASDPKLPDMPLAGETVSLFCGNIAVNSRERVMRYLCKGRWDGWVTEEAELPIVDTVEEGARNVVGAGGAPERTGRDLPEPLQRNLETFHPLQDVAGECEAEGKASASGEAKPGEEKPEAAKKED